MAAIISQTILGGWLFLSAFMWPHDDGQFMLAVVGGFLGCLFSAIALFKGKQDMRNGLLGGWLVFGALALPAQSRISSANHVIVGLALLLFSQIEAVSPRRLQ
jgi:urea transporter